MHTTASVALAHIRGVACCALRALESEGGVRDLESIAQALSAIAVEAQMAHEGVDDEAERHGIPTIDAAWHRRLNAMHWQDSAA